MGLGSSASAWGGRIRGKPKGVGGGMSGMEVEVDIGDERRR